mmetsp:Transcript_21164/g.68467  ORF Transcript_21164/g.68467 Transcript_21164/m.68467 type:complete len:731 (-) Transcript_21164:396-2588(-)
MPCTYKTETYNEVLRWLDNTPIKYAANPKLKTSKSFVRYAKYAKAKTVGEALRFGTLYLDLLFDHEHGHLKATGQPKRKQLVSPDNSEWDDSWNATDKILSKMHAKWITWSKTFEVADRLGVDRRNLTSNKMGGISVEMHAQRMEAQVMAKLILEEADSKGLLITDADVLHVLKLWAFKDNTTRQNVMKESIDFVNSDTLGLLAGYDGTVQVNQSTRHYPAVPHLLTRWLKDHLPDECGMKENGFHHTSINVNRGYAAKLHRDGNNEGPSMIAAFGEFTGGELNYWPEDDKTKATLDKLRQEDRKTLDLRRQLLLFDGNRGHSVEDFQGERYSIVFFSIGKSHKVNEKQRQLLMDVGIRVPDAKSLVDMKKLLSPPLGYGDVAEKAPAGPKRHPLRFWARPKKEKAVVSGLSKEKMHQAIEAARCVEPPEDDEDLPAESSFVSFQMTRKTNTEGFKVVMAFLKGASGRLMLAIEGVEEKQDSAKFHYQSVPSCTLGKALDTHRLGEVRKWLQQVVTKTGGAALAELKKKKKGKAAEEKASAVASEKSPKASAKASAKESPAKTPEKSTGRKRAASTTPGAPEDAPSTKKQRRGSSGATDEAPPGKKPRQEAKAALAHGRGPSISKKEALEQLCRCSESTSLTYAPDGKTAESHKGSYERYQRYAAATNFKEGLELGSGPADIVYDLQAGLLKITGTKRKGTLLAADKLAAAAEGRFGKLAGKWREALSQL